MGDADQDRPDEDPAGGDPADDADAARRHQAVADGLRDAFAALGAAGIPDEERPRLHQRLIAITGSAKHDLATAERRLAAWWADYDATARRSGG